MKSNGMIMVGPGLFKNRNRVVFPSNMGTTGEHILNACYHLDSETCVDKVEKCVYENYPSKHRLHYTFYSNE